MNEEPWFIFKLPASGCVRLAIAHVPAPSEEQARRQLSASCYKGAPVHEWPCIGSRFCSRDALTRSMLRKRGAK